MVSGQGVGVWLTMAKVDLNLENRSWLGNTSWASGEDKIELAGRRSEVSFPIKYMHLCLDFNTVMSMFRHDHSASLFHN